MLWLFSHTVQNFPHAIEQSCKSSPSSYVLLKLLKGCGRT